MLSIKQPYSIGIVRIALILSNFLLSNCSKPMDPIPISNKAYHKKSYERKQANFLDLKDQKDINHPQKEDELNNQLTSKSFAAAGGYCVRFIYRKDTWLALVEINEATETNTYQVPVHASPEIKLTDLLMLGESSQRRRIHIIFEEQNKRIPVCVYVGTMGLLGGGGSQSTMKCNECGSMAQVTRTERHGFLWLQKATYYKCSYCAQMEIEDRELQHRREEQIRREEQRIREGEQRRLREEAQREREEIRKKKEEENEKAEEIARKKMQEEQKNKKELEEQEEKMWEEKEIQRKLYIQQMEREWEEETRKLVRELEEKEKRKEKEEKKQEEISKKELIAETKEREHEMAKRKLEEFKQMLGSGEGESVESLKTKVEEAMDNQELLKELTELLSARQEVAPEPVLPKEDI